MQQQRDGGDGRDAEQPPGRAGDQPATFAAGERVEGGNSQQDGDDHACGDAAGA